MTALSRTFDSCSGYAGDLVIGNQREADERIKKESFCYRYPWMPRVGDVVEYRE